MNTMKSNKNQSKNCPVEQGNKVEPVREEVTGGVHGEQNGCEALSWTGCCAECHKCTTQMKVLMVSLRPEAWEQQDRTVEKIPCHIDQNTFGTFFKAIILVCVH